MPRLTIFIAAALLLGVSMSCSQSDTPVVIHVFRDIHASFVEELKRADLQFGTTQPRVKSGKPVIVATNEGTSFQFLLTQFKESVPDVVIFDSQANIPFDSAVRSQLAKAELVCGQHPSFIPTSISGEEREAAEMYVFFLVSQCPTSVTNSAAAVDTQTIAKGEAAEKDPHRPSCIGAQCREVKSYVKAHYCGAPEGNGPDDSCAIRQPKKRLNVKMTANYDCKWVDGVRNCKQQGEPTSEMRGILIDKLRGLGLPAKAKGQIYFTVWQPIGLGWSLVGAYYDHIDGSDVTLCQVIAIVGQNSHVSVLRKVPFQKTDEDRKTVTTWTPLDLAYVSADGQTEIVLEGDAYEDHWIEVVGMKNGLCKTIFSGLGYYL